MNLTNHVGLKPLPKGTRLRRWNAEKTAQMISMLTSEPRTIHDLVDGLNVNKHVVYLHIRAMRAQKPRIIRIAEWVEYPRPTGMLWIAAYQLGSAADAKRPPKKSTAEKCRDYRLRKRLRILQAAIAGVHT
jgi:hypothetical protein